MNETTFFDLPFEIKVHILKDLDVVSLLKLCELYPSLKECTKERQINAYFNFSGLYDLNQNHLKSSCVASTFRMESITTLNINSVYWITMKSWITFISKLCNLKCLYAIDTVIKCNDEAMPIFKNLEKLETLAISIRKGRISTSLLKLYETKLTKLFLHGDFINLDTFRLAIFTLKKLKEVWLITIKKYLTLYTVEQLPKDVAKYMLNVRFLRDDFITDQVTMTHRSVSYQYSFENPSENSHLKIYNTDTKYDNLFDKLVGCCYPFCRKDSEEIVLKSILPSDMNLTELNLKHKFCFDSKLTSTVRSILLSNNTKLVKKLAINFCLCEQSITNSLDENYQPLFKKQRIGVPNKGFTKSIFEETVDNMTLLEELEIWDCSSFEKKKMVTNHSLSCIQNLRSLQKLSLKTIPVHIDGQFLIPIAANCKKLKSLRLQFSTNLTTRLCFALKYMNNLKDLLIVQGGIMDFKDIFKSIVANKNLKLNRICLQFDDMFLKDTGIVHVFLETNDQLVFLGFVTPFPNSKQKFFNRMFNNYRSPKRVFLVTRSVAYQQIDIPQVHATQMVDFSTQVGVVNIFKDF